MTTIVNKEFKDILSKYDSAIREHHDYGGNLEYVVGLRRAELADYIDLKLTEKDLRIASLETDAKAYRAHIRNVLQQAYGVDSNDEAATHEVLCKAALNYNILLKLKGHGPYGKLGGDATEADIDKWWLDQAKAARDGGLASDEDVKALFDKLPK